MIEKELPLFPLNLVAYPGEELNLHIFEPRYRQLITECVNTNTTFGVPSYVLSKIEYGTEVKIVKLEKTYDDGRMDVRTVGMGIFKVLDFVSPWPGKLYAGGTVEMIKADHDGDVVLQEELFKLANDLFEWLGMEGLVKFDQKMLTYAIAHKIGLSKEQEYELLKMTSERKRQEFLINYLKLTIPIVKQMEQAKDRIRQNGHFKHLDALDF
ncbi:LON peptidase substrate-binding domain-containing protein [uncultured Imperialibacter sp.]|uniref:LON peptidase substrate-binding domain-containing protein n=1 Tax=uncultured Imperialibacter sp. TaxID=1672639 RepID=UPI0030DD4BBB|tara:strand:+ start:5730 stop:6362 length:633 start_codon:yes stop_codon:yes gene_type:complete